MSTAIPPARKLTASELLPQFPDLKQALQCAQTDDSAWSNRSFQPEIERAIQLFLSNSWYRLLCIELPTQEMLPDTLQNLFSTLEMGESYHIAEFGTFSELFGQPAFSDQGPYWELGVLPKLQPSILILRLDQLCTDLRLDEWLWRALETQKLVWQIPDYQLLPSMTIPLPNPIELKFRLICVGTAECIEEYTERWEQFHHRYLFARYQDRYRFKNKEGLAHWIHWITSRLKAMGLPPMTEEAWMALLTAAIEETKDHTYLPTSSNWLERQFAPVALLQPKDAIPAKVIEKCSMYSKQCSEDLIQETLHEILSGQVTIVTEGALIGQVNGLTVFGRAGDPYEIGVPTRISCVSFVGEPTVGNVEHKVALAGSFHAKGILILEAYLTQALQLPYPLPFSASVVFEQSYGEIDGDSATLASACAVLSSLAEIPISQSIALTGALDQAGAVLPVGGLSEKILGFFLVCQARGFNGKQGVIIPEANYAQLILPKSIQAAVRAKAFHIWTVQHLAQAIPLLAQTSETSMSYELILDQIRMRAESIHMYEPPHKNKSLLSWFLG